MTTPPQVQRPRVYLAGPEVFLPDAHAAGRAKKQLCDRHGLEGLFPFDAEVSRLDRSPRDTAFAISAANETLIRGCAAIIANMTPFRGPSADVGTAYELGFARGMGLILFAYSNVATPFTERTQNMPGTDAGRDAGGCLRDAAGMAIEEFDLMDNLMLEGGIEASGGQLIIETAPEGEIFTYLGAFETCVRLLCAIFAARSNRVPNDRA